jgi:hypothetical protein
MGYITMISITSPIAILQMQKFPIAVSTCKKSSTESQRLRMRLLEGKFYVVHLDSKSGIISLPVYHKIESFGGLMSVQESLAKESSENLADHSRVQLPET